MVCLSSLHRGAASLRRAVSVLGFRTIFYTFYVGYLFAERVFRLWWNSRERSVKSCLR